MLTLLIPVFNEEGIIERIVQEALSVLRAGGRPFEILLVNDGSTDGTSTIIRRLNIPELRIVDHPVNRGYGASMKTGIRQSKGDIIATVDADGTYPLSSLPDLLKDMEENNADMVVGARTKKGVRIPWNRRPAKWIVNKLANFLVGMRIPDLNSGMRAFRKDLAVRFMHLYPQRFSFTITITLSFLSNDYIVRYVPIDYFKRTGKSTLSSGMNGLKNFIAFLGLIVRITTYFRPLKFFAFPSVLLLACGFFSAVYTLYTRNNISDAELLLMLTGLQIGLFGILAEIVARQSQAHKQV